MKAYQPSEIRNVALIGATRSGKTSLAEALLFEAGMIKRKGTIEEKNTISDYREIEIERQSSVYLTAMYVEYKGKKINIIDTPGIDEFVGEVLSALKVCEAALVVINAQSGVEVGTEILWRFIIKNEKPVIFIINQLDHDKANFDQTIQSLKTHFGNKVLIAQYPIEAGSNFKSIVDVIKMQMLTYSGHGIKPTITEVPEQEKVKLLDLRNSIIEASAESNEKLMEKYFEEGTLSDEEIFEGLIESIKQRNIYPVLCVSSKLNYGIDRLLEYITLLVPAPNEVKPIKLETGEELPCNSDNAFSALVFKTFIEPHIGELAFLKIYSGFLIEGTDVINANKSTKERISQIFVSNGKIREKIEKAYAGDIVSTVKLKSVEVNSTLNSIKTPDLIIEPINFLEPKIRTAVKAVNSADDEKLTTALQEYHKIDPTMKGYYSKELKQIIIEAQGELHLNIIKSFIETKEKISIEFKAPKIPYRETITKPARAAYRHKKQSGGAGQFGEVHLMIEPYVPEAGFSKEFSIRNTEEYTMSWGGKLIFNNCIVGGAIDARFMPSILKGIMEKMEEGPLTGSYARDIVVYIYDGKMHPVDSNDISFRLAGRNAFKEAFKNASPILLEPIYDTEIYVPNEYMGDVITDLQGRRGIVIGMSSEGNYQIIKAKLPLEEIDKYSKALNSITRGKATYTMKFSHYQQVPPDIQMALVKAYEAEEKE